MALSACRLSASQAGWWRHGMVLCTCPGMASSLFWMVLLCVPQQGMTISPTTL